ncbi:Gag-Pol polyprotein [Dictyocoela roeselum]|nr:Gag-Pol polyprotein [Dictyocoela roeselum]
MKKNFVKNKTEYDALVDILRNKNLEFNKDIKYRLKRKARYFLLLNNMLYYRDDSIFKNHKLVIHLEDENSMETRAKEIHEKSHIGFNKMESICKEIFFCIKRDIIRNVVRDCEVCRFSFPMKTSDKTSHVIASFPNQRFQIDLIDLKKISDINEDYKYILSVIDIYSRFGIVRALKSKSGGIIANTLREIFYEYGPCQILQSDNGLEFKNAHVQELCEEFNITQIHGRPNHPQSQGIVERFNQTITRFISKQLNNEKDKIWYDKLKKVVYYYNITAHAAFKKSPFVKYRNIKGFNTIIPDLNEILPNSGENKNSAEMKMTSNLEEIAKLIPNSEENSAKNAVETPVLIETHESNMISDFESEDEFLKSWVVGEKNLNEKYYKRMDKKMNVHDSKYDFCIGKKVRVYKDFGTNPSLKLDKFESKYKDIAIISQILSNNRALITYEDGKTEIVKMSQIKK